MKLSFSTLGCPDWSWGEILSAAKDLGYDGIEVRGVNDELFVPKIFQGKEEKIEKELKRLNLSIPCLTSACYLNEKDKKDQHVQDGKRYIDTAKVIGSPYIRLLGDYGPEEEYGVDPKVVIDAAQELCEYAKGSGVTLLIETNGYFADSSRLAKLLMDINSDCIGALWDVHHPYRYRGESAKDTYDNLKGYIKHVHMKDSVMENGKVHYRIMGNGDLPIASFVEALENGGYDGFYSLEWTKRWNLDLEAPSIAFANYVDYMKHL